MLPLFVFSVSKKKENQQKTLALSGGGRAARADLSLHDVQVSGECEVVLREAPVPDDLVHLLVVRVLVRGAMASHYEAARTYEIRTAVETTQAPAPAQCEAPNREGRHRQKTRNNRNMKELKKRRTTAIEQI